MTRDKLERIRNYKTNVSAYTKDINKLVMSKILIHVKLNSYFLPCHVWFLDSSLQEKTQQWMIRMRKSKQLSNS